MIGLSNTTAQTLQPGQAITFDIVTLHSGTGECHRRGTSSVKMKQHGIYEVTFTGQITGTATQTPQLNIALGGDILAETIMRYTVPTTGYVGNVATITRVKNCCCDYDRLTVVNSGTVPVTVDPNTSFTVKRVS